MTLGIPRPAKVRTVLASSFGRFCIVGAIGFVVDTAVLMSLVRLAALPPVPAKILSFAVALLVTFQFNRMWAFAAVRHGSVVRAFAAYLGVQGAGAACNLATFALCTLVLPQGLLWLGLGAVLASMSALLVNYLGASRFVFLAQRRGGPTLRP